MGVLDTIEGWINPENWVDPKDVDPAAAALASTDASVPAQDAPTSGVSLVLWMREHFGTANTLFGPFKMFEARMSDLVHGLALDPEDPRVDIHVGLSAQSAVLSSGESLVGGYWPSGQGLFSGDVAYGKVVTFSNVPVDQSQLLIIAASDSYPIHAAATVPGDRVPFKLGDPGTGTAGTGDTWEGRAKDAIPAVLQTATQTAIVMAVVVAVVIGVYLLWRSGRLGGK